MQASRRHSGFRRWHYYAVIKCYEQDLNETGPVTEHVFEARRIVKCLMDFMREEGYTEEEVRDKQRHVNDLQVARMNLAYRRWRHWGTPGGRLMMKAYDHLRLLTGYRKLMRFQLMVCNNRVAFMKADMQAAFNKWREADSLRAAALNRVPRAELNAWNIKQTKDMHRRANREAENDALLKHLSFQRDELLEHYIRGQKLALSACKARQLKAFRICWLQWHRVINYEKRQEAQERIVTYVDRLADMKAQIRRSDEENRQLATENEELRRYYMNGF